MESNKMQLWKEYNLNTGGYTGRTLLFFGVVTPKYYLNMKDGGDWVMSPHGSCMNKNRDTTWHVKKVKVDN